MVVMRGRRGEGHAMYSPIKEVACQRVRACTMPTVHGVRRSEMPGDGAWCMVHGAGAWCWCMVLLEARRESTVPEGHSAGQNLHHKLHRAPANSSSVSCELKRDPVCVSYTLPQKKRRQRVGAQGKWKYTYYF